MPDRPAVSPRARAHAETTEQIKEIAREHLAIDGPNRSVRADCERVAESPGFTGVPPTRMARAWTAWAQLFGTISFELFGRLTNAVTDYDAYFELQLRVMSRYLGLNR